MNGYDYGAKRTTTGWTFIEMLVAISITAMAFGAATLVFSSISVNSKRYSTLVKVTIGTAFKKAIYDEDGDDVNVYSAPNYGRAAYAQEFRNLLREDIEEASLVHCLSRALTNTYRPEFIPYPDDSLTADEVYHRLDSPDAFRGYLLTIDPALGTIYSGTQRNVPSAPSVNTSIFVMSPDETQSLLRVNAVYEIDYIDTGSPTGTYVSVRRYKNGALTHYYDIFFEAPEGSVTPDIDTLCFPNYVNFERVARRAVNEGIAIDRFKIAKWTPFYLVWLPDPAINPHRLPYQEPSAPPSSPLSAYEHMGQRSSLSLVVPIFPQL